MRQMLTSIVAAAALGGADAQAAMRLTSQDLTTGRPMAGAQVFDQFGCKGANASPELSWSGAPANARSFAVLAFDPDAPTGSGWWHWVAFNIPAGTTRLAPDASRRGMPPGAVQGRNDFGMSGYGGACPPPGQGVHRYRFTVYALSVDDLAKTGFPIDANAPAAMVSFAVHATALDKATIEVPYQR